LTETLNNNKYQNAFLAVSHLFLSV